jgi:hypothetical protein
LSDKATDQIIGLARDLENLDNMARFVELCRTERY